MRMRPLGARPSRFFKSLAIRLLLRRGQLGTPTLSHTRGTAVATVDDEEGMTLDGVRGVFNVDLNRTTATQIDVFASAYGAVDAWIDWNRDGDFNDPYELLMSGAPVWPGMNALSVVTPSASDIGFDVTAPSFTNNAILRLRISRNGGLLADQIAVGGEIEDSRITIVSGRQPLVTNVSNNTNRTFRWDEDVNGDGVFSSATGTSFNSANPNYGIILPGAVDRDGNPITVLEIIDPRTGVASRIQAGSGAIVGLQDSLGRTAGDLTVLADGNFTFRTKADYNTQDLPGADRILGTSDDLDPSLVFFLPFGGFDRCTKHGDRYGHFGHQPGERCPNVRSDQPCDD